MDRIRSTVVFEWDPEEQYVATTAALSAGSYGATSEEALEKVKEAAEVTIEGLKATGQPVPSGDEDRVAYVEVVDAALPH